MMKVVEALNCVKCGSNNLSCNDGFFICEYCNTKHVLVNDSLVKVFEKNELYKTADLYFEWRQYDIASEKYKEIVYKWAYESLAWWGIVKCMTENFLKIEISEDYYKNIEKYAVRAFETADPTTRVDLESQWKMYTNQVSSLFNTKKEKIKADVENKRLEQEEKMRQNVYVAFLGMKEEDIFRAVTSSPAKALQKAGEWGILKEGGNADICVLDYTDEPYCLTDKAGNRVENKKGYRCILTISDGNVVYRR